MKVGGQIPWNAIPICETFKICCLMGKLHTKGVLENHSMDPSFRLLHWLSIILFLRKTSQESINLERKSHLDCSSDTLCTRGEFGRVTYWSQTLRSWRRWTHQKSTLKTHCEGSKISHRNGKFIFPVADGRIKISGGDLDIHFDTGSPNLRRKSKGFSWRTRRVSSTTSRLISGCR